jgi:hypothetical protein
MLTKMMKFVSIAALILAATFWSHASTFQPALCFIVSLGAILVALQAGRAAKYVWATGFYAVTLLFNPLFPILTPSGSLAFSTVLTSAVLFAASLFALRTRPLLSIPSITDRTPGSESL